MRHVLLAAATAFAIAAPAAAHPIYAHPSVSISSGLHADFGRFGHRHDRRRHRDVAVGLVGPWYDSRDFDGNRSFDPDRWNDWWHERPRRAYPAWVQHNEGCTPDRMWWGGGVWRCSW